MTTSTSDGAGFQEIRLDVNGIDTLVLTAGAGDPVVFFHGAGTASGFDWLLPIAAHFRLIVATIPASGDREVRRSPASTISRGISSTCSIASASRAFTSSDIRRTPRGGLRARRLLPRVTPRRRPLLLSLDDRPGAASLQRRKGLP